MQRHCGCTEKEESIDLIPSVVQPLAFLHAKRLQRLDNKSFVEEQLCINKKGCKCSVYAQPLIGKVDIFREPSNKT